MTLPKMLKEKGYKTGIVGKWHLGLGDSKVDYNQRISPGPNEVGFDYSFIMPDTQDRVPTVYVENGNVINLNPMDPIQVSFEKNFEGQPTGKDNPELLSMKWHHGHNGSIVNGIPRIGFMKGGEEAKWSDIHMADEFLIKAKNYIKNVKGNPFFLFYTLQQPHVPRTPHPRFDGLSGMGPRGDAIIEADWCIGELYTHLKKNNLLENTIIILSSDNGPVLNDGYYDDAIEKLGSHTPSGNLRGGKYSLFDAGTRVPFITYWEGKIVPQVSDEIVSQIDFLNSIASLIGSSIRSEDGEDLANVLFNNSGTGRNDLVLEAMTKTAFRSQNWVLIPPYSGPDKNPNTNIESGIAEDFQLYNLNIDISQQNNLATSNPKKLNEMIERYEHIIGVK
jgi:arylsulfatase A-like enzyme